MIVFDLTCRPHGHVFEAWFGSSRDFEDQSARGLLACPICGAAEIEKSVMAPNVGLKGNQKSSAPSSLSNPAPAPMADGVPDAETVKTMLRALAEVQTRMLETSVYVGDRFADEARAIHYGERDHQAIHGQATPAQARALVEDGIEIAALPFPVLPPDSLN